MNEYESPEERPHPPKNKFRQPPPYQVGEQVLYESPVTNCTLVVEFRGWDGDMAVVMSSAHGALRVELRRLRKKTWL